VSWFFERDGTIRAEVDETSTYTLNFGPETIVLLDQESHPRLVVEVVENLQIWAVDQAGNWLALEATSTTEASDVDSQTWLREHGGAPDLDAVGLALELPLLLRGTELAQTVSAAPASPDDSVAGHQQAVLTTLWQIVGPIPAEMLAYRCISIGHERPCHERPYQRCVDCCLELGAFSQGCLLQCG